MKEPPISRVQALEYEVRSSWWSGFVCIGFLQELAARYYTWKVSRKMRRYEYLTKYVN